MAPRSYSPRVVLPAAPDTPSVGIVDDPVSSGLQLDKAFSQDVNAMTDPDFSRSRAPIEEDWPHWEDRESAQTMILPNDRALPTRLKQSSKYLGAKTEAQICRWNYNVCKESITEVEDGLKAVGMQSLKDLIKLTNTCGPKRDEKPALWSDAFQDPRTFKRDPSEDSAQDLRDLIALTSALAPRKVKGPEPNSGTLTDLRTTQQDLREDTALTKAEDLEQCRRQTTFKEMQVKLQDLRTDKAGIDAKFEAMRRNLGIVADEQRSQPLPWLTNEQCDRPIRTRGTRATAAKKRIPSGVRRDSDNGTGIAGNNAQFPASGRPPVHHCEFPAKAPRGSAAPLVGPPPGAPRGPKVHAHIRPGPIRQHSRADPSYHGFNDVIARPPDSNDLGTHGTRHFDHLSTQGGRYRRHRWGMLGYPDYNHWSKLNLLARWPNTALPMRTDLQALPAGSACSPLRCSRRSMISMGSSTHRDDRDD